MTHSNLTALVVAFFWMTTAQPAVTHAQPASYPATPEALAALASTPDVSVTSLRDQLYTFRPTSGAPTTGIILYPGGFVDFRAYALLARDLARAGYVAVIVKMPLDIAFLGYKRALLAQFVNRDIRRWVVGGHSLGGVASCTYAKEFTSFVEGVVLLASYPSSSDSLRRTNLKVVSIYGTNDGLTDASDIDRSVRLLPASTTFVAIEGGNHTQFGAYWDGSNPAFLQPGDLPATITPAAQRARIVDAIRLRFP
jgi:dienelactone hydrolase